jgi:hypothetical protein
MRPAFNWFCVLCSASDVLAHAAHIRAAQLTSRTSAVVATRKRKKKETEAWHSQDHDALEADRLPRQDGQSSGSLASDLRTQDKSNLPSPHDLGRQQFTVFHSPINSDVRPKGPLLAEAPSGEDTLGNSRLNDGVLVASDPSVGIEGAATEVRHIFSWT